MSCHVVLEGGLSGRVQWPLVPIRDITDPVVVEPIPGEMLHTVRVDVVDSGGRAVDIALVVCDIASDKSGASMRMARSGEPVLLPKGRYLVEPSNMPAKWLKADFEKASFSLGEGDGAVVTRTISLSEPMRLVRATPLTGQEHEHDTFHATVSCSKGSFGVMNWQAHKGPMELLLPLGEARIRVQGARLHADVRLTVTQGEGAQEVAVPLQRGPMVTDPSAERHRVR